MRAFAHGLLGALALTLALAGPALADTTVSVDVSSNLTVTGNDEASSVTIAQSGTDAFTVTDPGGDLIAAGGCTGGGASVSCTGVTQAIIAHGNGGNDSITVTSQTTRRALLFGEGGDDKLTGGAGTDRLRDDLGVDELRGGDNADDLQDCGGSEDSLLMGEGGRDVIATCAGGSKELNGGPGDDFLSANITSGRAELVGGDGVDDGIIFAQVMSVFPGVSVSLDDQPNDGPPGGTTNWHSDVENVFTAGAADTITGSPGPNTIRSDAFSSGNGFSNGTGGNDTIDPGGGVDHVYAGGGDDTIVAKDATPDAINCGSNVPSPFAPDLPPVDNDTVTGDGVDDFTACEHVTAESGTPPDVRAPVVTVKAPRSISARAFRKGLRVQLAADEPAAFAAELRAAVKGRRGGRLAFAGAVGEVTIGQGRLAPGAGTRSLRLKASKRFAKAVRGRALRLVVRVTATDAAGNVAGAARRVRVKGRAR